MKKILLGILFIVLLTPIVTFARCNDVGNVLGVYINSGMAQIETSTGYFILPTTSLAVPKGPEGRACYDNVTNQLCFGSGFSKKCYDLID